MPISSQRIWMSALLLRRCVLAIPALEAPHPRRRGLHLNAGNDLTAM